MYQQKKIEGVNVVSCKIPHVNSVYIGIWIKAGSMYESKLINGVSHFIEHLVFKGSHKRSARQIAEEMDSIGGQLNGFTEKEDTCFYIKVLGSHLEKGIDILFDMVFNPAFREEDILKEKQVVFEEILSELDSPEDVAYNLLAKTAWKGHSLSFPVLGTFNTIKNLNRNHILDYYNRHYVKDKVVVSVAGNFDDRIYDILKPYLQKIKEIKSDNALLPPLWHKDVAIYEKDFEQVNLCIGLPSISYDLKKVYALSIANNAFGGGMSSRLFQKIREDKGLVYSIYSYPVTYPHAGMFAIFASMTSSNFRKVYDLIVKEIEEISKNGVTKEEFEKFKEQLKINLLMDQDSISARMSNIGKSLLLFDRVYLIEDALKVVEEITFEEVNQLAKMIIKPDEMTVSVVGKLNKKDKRWLENVNSA
ncbi:M16 family metallopeptidase [Caldanaerobacter sp.]|uniref:M16 family metallopeptidase n=1 Tax=Caldanaerobacter sp. TaxID=2930036 RepID=UPI003C791C68